MKLFMISLDVTNHGGPEDVCKMALAFAIPAKDKEQALQRAFLLTAANVHPDCQVAVGIVQEHDLEDAPARKEMIN